jgi:hypothetical protein
MADNFLQFALSFQLNAEAEEAWCADTLEALTEFLDATTGQKKLMKKLGELGRRAVDEDWGYLGFDWSVEQPRTPDAHAKLYLYAEQSGDPDQVAAVLEEYLKKFNPTGVITFSWATTCSKMRIGEFSGGAAVVTATGTKFLYAQSWAEEEAQKLARPYQHSTGVGP